jgi:hypothetical protein
VTTENPSRVVICRGAIATERRLLAELDTLAPSTADDLALQVRVVVPSRSLRLHLLRRLVRRRGAIAGVVVQTLGGLATEVMERAGSPRPGGLAAFEVLARRLARGERVLASELDGLSDGYDVVQGAVRDLVDAGFTADHEDAVLERLAELAAVVPRSNRDRVEALVRVAARALDSVEITDAHPRAAIYTRAAEILRERGAGSLPSRAIVIHGFADLTGVATDLLTTILLRVGGVVLLDRVPDPSNPGLVDAGNSFLDRLRLVSLGGLGHEESDLPEPAPVLHFAEAPNVEAEARGVAEAVRSIVDGGTEPEDIGIVARSFGGLGTALRRQLGRLGIPFSGVGAGVPGGLLRRKTRRLADLLRLRGDAELDLWTEVAEGLVGPTELLLGMRVLSLARLKDLVSLDPGDGRLFRDVPLPVASIRSVEETAYGTAARPRLSSARIAETRAAATSVLDALENTPDGVPAIEHRLHFVGLLASLGWDLEGEVGRRVASVADDLADDFPPRFDLRRDEWASALIDRLEELGETEIGGAGGGVQLLTVMEARARTFSHLLLCGCNRGVFPRVVQDDALLPDLVRARLAVDVLPQMPVKGRSADEERYLFAQLVSSAPEVTLSWHLSAEGRRMAPSPFVDRLAASGGSSIDQIPPLWALARDLRGPRPAYESAVLGAMVDGPDLAAEHIERAVVEGRRSSPDQTKWVAARRLAESRLQVIRAVEGDGAEPSPGPWSGFVGDATSPPDRLWVTALEGVATCPWQSFVGRRLGVRPLPDPNLELPDPDQRLVGSVVHEVLERIVVEATGATRVGFDSALELQPNSVPWPSDAGIESILTDAARRVVFEEGLSGFGLARLLAARARPVLEVAAEVEWNDSTRLDSVLAAEITGEVPSPVSGRSIAFRADRLDTGPVATDYKTGAPLSKAKKAETRLAHLVTKVGRGRVLQAVAYALAGPDDRGAGRYVSLKPDIGDAPGDCRIVEASWDNEDLRSAFWAAVEAIEKALETGAVFPRVREADGTAADHCRFCPVAEACRWDDSTFTGRLIGILEGENPNGDQALRAARELWWLGFDRENEA